MSAAWVLGLSTSGHDPALALADPSGRIVYAEATERFVQDKRAWGIAPDHPPHLEAALAAAGFVHGRDALTVATSWASVKADLDVKVHDALLPATDTIWMRGLHGRMQAGAGASLLRLGLASDAPVPMRFDHHLCHAVSAAWFAPVDDAACLVLDGEGEVGAVSLHAMTGRRMRREWRSWGPGSLGSFYGWLTGLCGFDWRLGEEWKVMGLAGFGTPRADWVAAMRGLLQADRGRLRFAPEDEIRALRAALAPHARRPAAPLMEGADLAASAQAAFAAIADEVLAAAAQTGAANLMLAGGCALNSSWNGTIPGRHGFDRVLTPPCPADDGAAIGAALLGWMQLNDVDRIPMGDGSPYLGAAPRAASVAAAGRGAAAAGMKVTDVSGRAPAAAAELLAEGRILGVMRGRAEFGPRALGARSILADPRRADMKNRINARVKGRESYRPFAPVMAEARLGDWFSRWAPSPYMSMTLPWTAEAARLAPAVVHADGTGRVQSVTEAGAPFMHALVEDFGARTGVPIVLNTSFNVMGKPIVHSVEDAMAVLMTTGLDAVMLEDMLIEKPC